VGRTALGTERYLEWSRHPRIEDAAETARSDGFRVVGVELADESRPFFELVLHDDVCLVVGSESNGLNQAALDCCDAVGYLPQLGRVGSFNVAVAAAMAMYEARRQAWHGR
jgi:tRNA (guanosine-2'-O-)-methyltransferase